MLRPAERVRDGHVGHRRRADAADPRGAVARRFRRRRRILVAMARPAERAAVGRGLDDAIDKRRARSLASCAGCRSATAALSASTVRSPAFTAAAISKADNGGQAWK
jgi:hypothetical protein